MGKRENDEGSIIRRKDGLYMARYTVQTATGTKRRILSTARRVEKWTRSLPRRRPLETTDASWMPIA